MNSYYGSMEAAYYATNIHVATSEEEMLDLVAKKGDLCIRTDISKTYALKADPASTLSNWVEIIAPISDVVSVNGKSGTVVLSGTDIDDNTLTTTSKNITGAINEVNADGFVTTQKLANTAVTTSKTSFLEPSYTDLYDESKVITGGYWTLTGTWEVAPTVDSSGKLPVTAGLAYTNTEPSWRVTWWKSDQSFLTYTEYTVFQSQGYVIAPTNAAYANFTFSASNPNRHIIQGTAFPVNDIVFSDLVVNTENINTSAVTTEKVEFLSSYNLYAPSDDHGYYDYDGTWVPTATVVLTDFIQVISGQPYTTSNTTLDMNWFDSDKNFISRSDETNGYWIAPSNAKYGRFLFRTSDTNRIVTNGYIIPSKDIIFPEILIQTEHISNGAVTQEKISTNWSGKNWVSYGDSITWYGYWQPYVVSALHLTHTNCGVSGSPIGGDFSNAMWQTDRINSVISANPDVVTILGGANDKFKSVYMGTDDEYSKALASKDKLVFKGAYSFIIETLLTWKPTLRIFLMTTMWGAFESINETTGLTYRDFAKATKEIAWYYGLPCIDLRGELGLNALTANTYLMDDSQYVHPNDAGAKRMAEVVVGRFKNINPI